MSNPANAFGNKLLPNQSWPSRGFIRANQIWSAVQYSTAETYCVEVFSRLGIPSSRISGLIGTDEIILFVYILSIRPETICKELQTATDHLAKILNKEVILVTRTAAKGTIDAKAISDLCIRQLRSMTAAKTVFKRMVRALPKSHIRGMRIQFRGRRSGTPRVKQQTFSRGTLGFGSYRSKVDYYQNTAILQYGTCSVRVWISLS